MQEDYEDLVQFFGVVIDATFPYKIGDNKYQCNLKVIDPTLNVTDGTGEFAIVIIQGRRF